MPIEPTYVGKTIDALSEEKVIVEWKELHGKCLLNLRFINVNNSTVFGLPKANIASNADLIDLPVNKIKTPISLGVFLYVCFMLGKREIMNKKLIDIAIERLSYQLIEKHNKFESSSLIGLQPRGAFLCKRVLKKLKFLLPTIDVKSGNLDISFYRDDLMRRDHPIEPDIMDINLSFEDKNIILVDDVLFTGRSIRSALDAILAFGDQRLLSC